MDDSSPLSLTCVAAPNIAIVKYWGKRDERLVLPLNDSLSATLDRRHLAARTTVAVSPRFDRDRVWLDGRELPASERLRACLAEARRRGALAGKLPPETIAAPVRVCSENDFPTGAGLASSAAGFACLAVALCRLYGCADAASTVARLGSGSACRGVFGGWVRWRAGEADDGSDSFGEPVAAASAWPELRALVVVFESRAKATPSTGGMRLSAATSELLRARADGLADRRADALEAAIAARDFAAFGEIAMRDSNQFHATCVDTYPPLRYMSAASWALVDAVHAFNDAAGRVALAYSFDAGPNAFVFCEERDGGAALALVGALFPSSKPLTVRGLPLEPSAERSPARVEPFARDAVELVAYTRVGDGPEVSTDPNDGLLDERGEPIRRRT